MTVFVESENIDGRGNHERHTDTEENQAAKQVVRIVPGGGDIHHFNKRAADHKERRHGAS